MAVAPVFRGSIWPGPMLMLELLGLFVLFAVAARAVLGLHEAGAGLDRPTWVLLLAPLAIAVVQLTPIPEAWWAQIATRAPFAKAFTDVTGASVGARAITLSPDLTQASLLASLPLLAAFLLGRGCTIRQLHILFRVLFVVAMLEVGLGLLQFSGGQYSPFYFGKMTYGSPIGSLPNRNVYASFLAMSLAGYLWLAYDAVRYRMRMQPGAPLRTGVFDVRHAIALWTLGGLILLLGALMSRSRAGALMAIAITVAGLTISALRVFGWSGAWRFTVPVGAVVLAAAVWLVGIDALTARVSSSQLAGSIGFRMSLAKTSWDAALAFLPWGSGWGTYELAYPRYQPASVPYTVDHAHMDYVQLLVEGGVLFVALAGLVAWMLARRAMLLARSAREHRTLSRDAMASTMCGLGLLAFLLHAAIDFPMRIPANAILACLLAGVFLRPLPEERPVEAQDAPAPEPRHKP